MTITYHLTISDFLAFQLYMSSKSELQNKRRRNARFFPPIFFLLYGVYLTRRDANFMGILIFIVTTILWIVLFPLYARWRYKRHFKKHIEENYKNRLNVPVEIEFHNDFITTRDFSSESKINGAELKEIIETSTHFFLNMTTDVSFIIPKHSIDNKEEFKKCVTEYGTKYIDERNWRWK
ncbi:MAG: YcxB family protein [Bacteroidota bacterium]